MCINLCIKNKDGAFILHMLLFHNSGELIEVKDSLVLKALVQLGHLSSF